MSFKNLLETQTLFLTSLKEISGFCNPGLVGPSPCKLTCNIPPIGHASVVPLYLDNYLRCVRQPNTNFKNLNIYELIDFQFCKCCKHLQIYIFRQVSWTGGYSTADRDVTGWPRLVLCTAAAALLVLSCRDTTNANTAREKVRATVASSPRPICAQLRTNDTFVCNCKTVKHYTNKSQTTVFK